ncbi:hypothetical protein KSP9073_01466 [Kushneria phyllosphaerae]|uniref:Uncharacterized protein n=1 Tax=Kushneria phyllosphaerae TaxID=2100822 RepID=A0A2R8CKM8_9GAMM|nr:hypothetical protein KSP9073_01466 [Kushneria phyllosphaerae]
MANEDLTWLRRRIRLEYRALFSLKAGLTKVFRYQNRIAGAASKCRLRLLNNYPGPGRKSAVFIVRFFEVKSLMFSELTFKLVNTLLDRLQFLLDCQLLLLEINQRRLDPGQVSGEVTTCSGNIRNSLNEANRILKIIQSSHCDNSCWSVSTAQHSADKTNQKPE